MFKRDYIQRQFEEFGKFMAIVFGLKKDGRWDELETLINSSARKFTPVEITEAEKIKDDLLLHELIEVHKLKSDELKMLGDLLYEKGLARTELLHHAEAANALRKALRIYDYIQQQSLESDFSLDMHFKIKSIRQLLGIQ
ncbi:MAG: hypothetical protein ACXVPQ_09350 [Bacteroidia bacterium]